MSWKAQTVSTSLTLPTFSSWWPWKPQVILEAKIGVLFSFPELQTIDIDHLLIVKRIFVLRTASNKNLGGGGGCRGGWEGGKADIHPEACEKRHGPRDGRGARGGGGTRSLSSPWCELRFVIGSLWRLQAQMASRILPSASKSAATRGHMWDGVSGSG